MSMLRLLLGLVTLSGLTLAQNSFTCANNDRTIITDSNGTQYILRCGSDTAETSTIATYTEQGFNACFATCSANCLGNQCAPCAGFTFGGAQNSNGTGSGYCYYKAVASNGYNTFSGDRNWALVGAIKRQYYPPMPPSYQCPAQDLNVVTDPNFGYQYVLGCGRETYGGSVGSAVAVADSFNDCFLACATFPGPGNCTAFTYSGAVNGAGAGTCYFKNVASYWVAAPAGSNLVGAIRYANYSGSGYTLVFPTTTTTTTTTSSSSRTSAVASSVASASRGQYCAQLFDIGPVVYCDM
ncbi:hypothetical protein AC579_6076 [Pseudocercospora musae]|uniref:Apple domain-containing protein n=1 Tax=Pseudocercospora musae TaxID=113226 RepID=A0A139IAR4_9PEZI|nr:hypothetical protein AC579_6076 [Pseudocercospora musae]